MIVRLKAMPVKCCANIGNRNSTVAKAGTAPIIRYPLRYITDLQWLQKSKMRNYKISRSIPIGRFLLPRSNFQNPLYTAYAVYKKAPTAEVDTAIPMEAKPGTTSTDLRGPMQVLKQYQCIGRKMNFSWDDTTE